MFVLINRIEEDTVEIKAEFILVVFNIEYHNLSFNNIVDDITSLVIKIW
jgi:hypothetical protein